MVLDYLGQGITNMGAIR